MLAYIIIQKEYERCNQLLYTYFLTIASTTIAILFVAITS